MSLTKKIGTGLTAAAGLGAMVVLGVYAAEYTVIRPRNNTKIEVIKLFQELAEPLEQEIDGIESKMVSIEPQYRFCATEIKYKVISDAGLQKCTKIVNEYAELQKELESPLQRYNFLLANRNRFADEIAAHEEAVETVLVYGSLGVLGVLGLGYLLQNASPLFKRKEENEEQIVNRS